MEVVPMQSKKACFSSSLSVCIGACVCACVCVWVCASCTLCLNPCWCAHYVLASVKLWITFSISVDLHCVLYYVCSVLWATGIHALYTFSHGIFIIWVIHQQILPMNCCTKIMDDKKSVGSWWPNMSQRFVMCFVGTIKRVSGPDDPTCLKGLWCALSVQTIYQDWREKNANKARTYFVHIPLTSERWGGRSHLVVVDRSGRHAGQCRGVVVSIFYTLSGTNMLTFNTSMHAHSYIHSPVHHHTQPYTLTHSSRPTHPYTLTPIHSLIHSLTHTPSPLYTHPHPLIHSLTYTPSHPPLYTHPHSLTCTPSHPPLYTHPHSLTCTPSHPPLYTHPHPLTHPYTLTPTHIHAPPSTHSYIHSPMHPHPHPLIHSLTHAPSPPSTHTFTHPYTHPHTLTPTHPLTHTPLHPPIHTHTHPSTHPYTLTPIHTLTPTHPPDPYTLIHTPSPQLAHPYTLTHSHPHRTPTQRPCLHISTKADAWDLLSTIYHGN